MPESAKNAPAIARTYSMSITHNHDDGIKDLDRKRFDGQHQDMIRIKEARNKTKLVEDKRKRF